MKTVSPSDAQEWLGDGKTIFIDIRDYNSYKAGHIPKAVYMDDTHTEKFLELTPKTARLVICCYHGNSSKGACRFLQEQGYAEAYSLNGGFEMWKMNGPVETGE